jgi:hypothetical protein
LECDPGRDEPRRTTTVSVLPSGRLLSAISVAQKKRGPWTHGFVAGLCTKRRRLVRSGITRHVLHPELVAVARSLYTPPDHPECRHTQGSVLKISTPCVQKPQPTPESQMASNSQEKVHKKLCETLLALASLLFRLTPPVKKQGSFDPNGRKSFVTKRCLLKDDLPDNSAPT